MDSRKTKELEQLERDAIIDSFGGYDRWYEHVGHTYLSRLELFFVNRCIGLSGKETVLDAGCADGRVALMCASRARKVIGIDHSAKSVEALRQRIKAAPHYHYSDKIDAHVGDLTDKLLGDGSVDRIVSIQVLQHIPTAAERLKTVKNFYDYLTPGGKVLLSVYRWWGPNGSEPQDGTMPGRVGSICFHRFVAEELQELFHAAGFRKIRVLPMKIVLAYHGIRVDFAKWGSFGLIADYLASQICSPRWFGTYLFVVGEK